MQRRLATVAMATLPLLACNVETNVIRDAISAGAPRNENVDDLAVVIPDRSEDESPVQRAPEAVPITLRVTHLSGVQAATVNVQFFIEQPSLAARIRQRAPPGAVDRIVRATTFQMRPGVMAVDIGPELASRVEVRGSFQDGELLRPQTYIFPIEFESPDGSLITYTIEDPRGDQSDGAGPAELTDDQAPDDETIAEEEQVTDAEIVVEEEQEQEDEDAGDPPPDNTEGNGGNGGNGSDGGDGPPIIDCNGNLVPDDTDIGSGTSRDCNSNGRPDECDIADGASDDLDGNGVPDECGTVDCNGNGRPDDQDVADCDGDPACGDCDQNGEPDGCAWDVADCDGNGLSDECEIGEGFVEDCNSNGAPDECDIADGGSRDFDEDGIPDECGLLVITPIESVATFGQTIQFTATQNVTWEASVSPDGDPDNNPGTIASDGTYSPPPAVDLMAAPVVRIRANSVATPGLFAIAQVTLLGSTMAAPRVESLLSGPGSPGQNPLNITTSFPVATALLPGQGDVNGLTLNVTSAPPPSSILLPGRGDINELNLNVTTADPPVAVLIPGTDDTGGLALNTFVSQPPVTGLLPGEGDGAGLPLNVTVADPPTMILLPGQGSAVLPLNVFVTPPPVVILLSGPGFSVLPLNVFVADPPIGIDFQ